MTINRRTVVATNVAGIITAALGVVLLGPLSRTGTVFCPRKSTIANSAVLCSTAEIFPLKKSSALTLAEREICVTEW